MKRKIKRKTVMLRMRREQIAVLEQVAKIAGASMNDTVNVILTLGVLQAINASTAEQKKEYAAVLDPARRAR
jgi:uncharacterized protein (DUF1778 family)